MILGLHAGGRSDAKSFTIIIGGVRLARASGNGAAVVGRPTLRRHATRSNPRNPAMDSPPARQLTGSRISSAYVHTRTAICTTSRQMGQAAEAFWMATLHSLQTHWWPQGTNTCDLGRDKQATQESSRGS